MRRARGGCPGPFDLRSAADGIGLRPMMSLYWIYDIFPRWRSVRCRSRARTRPAGAMGCRRWPHSRPDLRKRIFAPLAAGDHSRTFCGLFADSLRTDPVENVSVHIAALSVAGSRVAHMTGTQMFNWDGEDEPPAEWLAQLPVGAIVTHRGRAIGWWDGSGLQSVTVKGIWDGESIIPDPFSEAQ
jgi:hypothetical protein